MPRTVLVIEDDAATAALLREVLEDAGYRVLAAMDGPGLEVARGAHPDLILLDVNMPGMDGTVVSQRLRRDPATAHIPIIGLTARRSGLPPEMQAEAFVAKPFSLAEVCAAVARYLPSAEG